MYNVDVAPSFGGHVHGEITVFHETSHTIILQTYSGLTVIKFVEAEKIPAIARKYAFSDLSAVVMISTSKGDKIAISLYNS